LKDPVKTTISEDGLRYVSKEQGSDFATALGYSMSCFRCGQHRPRSVLESFLVAGTRQWRCRKGCVLPPA